jgi:hypothetical protein
MLIRPLSWLDRLLDRVFAVVGAAAFSQAPEYIQQYMQRLGGHVDEARHQVELIEKAARASDLGLSQYLETFLYNTDPTFQRQGELLQHTMQRAAELKTDLDAIQHASVVAKPFVFLTKMDYDIAGATLAKFKPAVPLTPENLIYAMLGLLFGMAVYHLVVKGPLHLIRPGGRRPARRATVRLPPSTAERVRRRTPSDS